MTAFATPKRLDDTRTLTRSASRKRKQHQMSTSEESEYHPADEGPPSKRRKTQHTHNDSFVETEIQILQCEWRHRNPQSLH